MKNKHTESVTATVLLTIKQAFTVNKNPLPWLKAFTAGICAGLPVLIGFLFGNLEYGLIAGIGGLTYLYVFNIPYAFRAKKLLFAVIGLSFVMGLGTLLAPYEFLSAIAVAIIGALVTFLFGALRITGPAGLFFVLTFLIATGMPADPEIAPIRAGLVFLGGAFSWIMGMIGWFNNPHGPEKVAVKKVYLELADFLELVGTDHLTESKQKIVASLKTTGDLLESGYIQWRVTESYKRLYLLNEQANNIFLHIIENMDSSEQRLPMELSKSIRSIGQSLDNPKSRIEISDHEITNDLTILHDLVKDASIIASESLSVTQREVTISKPSLRVELDGSFDKNSIVFLNAFRYGFVLFFATIVAQSFDFDRSYWVTLSCAAVLSGATIMITFHRTIQRSLGTIIGILLATLILYFQPEGYIIAIAIFFLTFLTELAIVLNYGIAALFITPNALLLAESTTKIHDISYFTSARVIDVLVGSAIGLIGTFLMNRKSAASLLGHTMAQTIRSEQQFILTLFSQESSLVELMHSKERSKMQTNLTNLKIVYSTARGEIPRDNTKLDLLFPAIHSIEHLGYLLDSFAKHKIRPVLSDNDLSKMLLIFETLAKSAEQDRILSKKEMPDISGFSKIQAEVHHLQDALQASASE